MEQLPEEHNVMPCSRLLKPNEVTGAIFQPSSFSLTASLPWGGFVLKARCALKGFAGRTLPSVRSEQ
jgi:hypothetical protein